MPALIFKFMHTQIKSRLLRFIAFVLCVSELSVFHRGGVLARADGAPGITPVAGAENTVEVQAADAESAEPLAGKENLGAFVIKRVGARDFELPVFYSVSGTARNGDDYVKLSGAVTIPKGSSSAEVIVKPLGDLLAEEDETVVLTLQTPACITIFPPPRTCYAVGTVNAAKVVLKNTTAAPANQAPKVALVSPSAGDVKLTTAGALAMAAEAGDSDGKVVVVEFFADNKSIGKQTELVAGRYVLAWTNPTVGEHRLFAQATDDRGAVSKSATVSIRVPQTAIPASSKLTIDHPKSGASFQELADISIDATAVDPKGYIARVEFYSGDDRIGVSEIAFIRAPEPGTPIKHNFVWKHVKAGKYSLSVRTTDSQRKTVRSDAISVTVEATTVVDQPVVSVTSTDQEASEDLNADRRANNAVFVISRVGGKDIELPVFYGLSGTAENGRDYAQLSGKVVIPKGSKSVEVVVSPILDSLKEGVESVVITIEPPACLKIFPPPPECYVVGKENQAKAVLNDSQAGPNPALPKSVLNINFGEGPTKKGLAATGVDSGDFWNPYVAPQKQIATLERLKYSDGTVSGIAITVTNAAGQWYNKTGDAMYDSYIYPNNTAGDGAGNIVATLKGVPAGKYDLFLYGKSEPFSRGESDSFFTIRVGDSKRGPLTTQASTGWTAGKPWVEGVQYVVFSGVEIKAGQNLEVTVAGGFDGRTANPLERPAVLNGLQLTSAVTVGPVNQPPKVTIIKPSGGQVFASPGAITFEAVAVDAEGPVLLADFYVDSKKVGSSSLGLVLGNTAGKEFRHSFVWSEPSVGTHVLTVKVFDTSGLGAESQAVKFEVAPKVAPSVVTRVLPKTVVPGTKFVVQIKVAPVKGTASYALEETPPKLWRVQSVPDNARFDAASGTLRIGPFFDDVARTFTYTLVPSSGLASGVFKFSGLMAVDTTWLEILGDNFVEYRFQYHPADSEPQNQVISLTEVTAYGAAWKKGMKWPVGPATIPAGYVTKAAAIWKGGGRYGIDGSLGDAPAWWVNITENASTQILTLNGGIILNNTTAVGTGSVWVMDDSTGAISFGTTPGLVVDVGPHSLSGASSVGRMSSAARSVARGLPVSSGSVRVQIDVVPTKTTSAYAVAEAIPAGWKVENANADGVVDPVNHELKWLFMDSTARSLSYVIRPESAGASSASRLSGMVSFDGQDATIQGDGSLPGTGAALGLAAARLTSVQRTVNGIVSLAIEGTVGAAVRVESSGDLQTWSLVFEGGLTEAESIVIDENAEGSAMRFYRLKTK